MLRNTIATLFFIAFILHSAYRQERHSTTINQPKPYEDADAYEVYSAILPSVWPWRVENAKTLVIDSGTRAYEMCLRPDPESQQVIGQAISEYVRLNEKTWLLKQNFKIEKPYELITSDELNRMTGFEEWKQFDKQHPNSGGWVELSAVGFNADKTVAVVYMGHHCPGLCGGGDFHVLQKKDGKWAPLIWRGESCLWRS